MRKRGIFNSRKKATAEKSVEKAGNLQTYTEAQKNLLAQIKESSKDLYYVSETDAEISPFAGGEAKNINKEGILEQTKSAADSNVEEGDFVTFFTRLTEIQDWFGDEEKATAQKFARLKELLEQNLRDLRVFKIGKIQLDIYVVGIEAEDKLMGIRTKAVET